MVEVETDYWLLNGRLESWIDFKVLCKIGLWETEQLWEFPEVGWDIVPKEKRTVWKCNGFSLQNISVKYALSLKKKYILLLVRGRVMKGNLDFREGNSKYKLRFSVTLSCSVSDLRNFCSCSFHTLVSQKVWICRESSFLSATCCCLLSSKPTGHLPVLKSPSLSYSLKVRRPLCLYIVASFP